MEQEVNKFTIAEILLGLFFTLLVDIIAGLIDFTAIGAIIIAPFIQTFAVFIIGYWFKRKGDANGLKLGRMIFKSVLQFLPAELYLIATLTTTIPFLIEALIHNNPKLTQTFQTISGAKALSKFAEKLKIA